ncbi:xylan 1,4-beta-xylosidase [Micromonospora phaseoli]|uniref:Xylan 1,4-beta-xylosidase n=1 Tax=Micromonospora phaseoli TaxID=1144548 RepID=A0A1H6S2E8_9ACTN|nr:glycoside hydrolase family 43 protein [Micromonospora phaseoli]PZW03726.1 xylan 1,4-beta-xylosidase [Micromonospora phaseoli]GIJ80289.1 xylan 1,4-beta-xylosidase [Micromonospora phaseoli]SEI60856.1 xylan 1,4-beta-xylosidase [Micromonospora phaseoli]
MSTEIADVATARSIRNPVLTGFHPDPSILRVDDDYYLATSTFEWYPGVRVHHSKDLVHWQALGGIVTERRLLDLRGCGDSNGIWAPDLTYHDGLFHLVYSDVASFASGYWDAQNFLTTAPAITGPWSDPVRLHSHGFDAALFHDDDGTTWLLAMSADWRPGRDRFGGIEIQQYDRARGQLVGKPRIIFTGTEVGLTEGPHIYRHDGWYWLVTAEGGTSWEHQVTVARSRDLFGPYEVDPAGPLLTSVGRPDLTLQKAGHGSLVRTPQGDWYLAHLVGRPYTPLGNCVLGRETALQKVDWSPGGWPTIPGGVPADEIAAPDLPAHPWPDEPATDDFDAPELATWWSTLRRPATDDWIDLRSRPSHLRVHGGQSPVGLQTPSLVARRVGATRCSLETVVEFEPGDHRHLAGITGYYNTQNWHYLYLTRADDERVVLELLSCDSGRRTAYPQHTVDTGDAGRVGLRVSFDGPALRFAYDLGDGWQQVPVELDATILSDEHAAQIIDGEPAAWGFTGSLLGLWVQDIGGDGRYADFDHATYLEH